MCHKLFAIVFIGTLSLTRFSSAQVPGIDDLIQADYVDIRLRVSRGGQAESDWRRFSNETITSMYAIYYAANDVESLFELIKLMEKAHKIIKNSDDLKGAIGFRYGTEAAEKDEL